MAEVTGQTIEKVEPKISRRTLLRSAAMLAASSAVAAACGGSAEQLARITNPLFKEDKAKFEETNTLDTFPTKPSYEGWTVRYPYLDELDPLPEYVKGNFSTRYNSVVDVIQFHDKDIGIAAQLYERSDGVVVPMLNVSSRGTLESVILRAGKNILTGRISDAVVFENKQKDERRALRISVLEERRYGSKGPQKSIEVQEIAIPPVRIQG